MLPKSTKTTDDQQTAGKRKASSSAHDFPDANSDPGKRAREADVASRGGKLSAFNHTGPIKSSVIAMGSGGKTTAKQFRDESAHSTELPSDMGRGRHEISSTSKRDVLVGNPVAVNVAATARISTALAPLLNDKGEVIGHTGEFSPEMTTGQSAAHQVFHDFGATLATQTDPHVAAALAIQTALDGTATPEQIRASATLTGAKWVGGGGPMEAPDTSRGDDDGYDSETERGRYARRVGVGREHLKDTLSAIRAVSDEATTATRPPSPRRLRGGRPAPEKNASRTALTLPDISADADADAATKLTTFAFAGFQTLKEN